jgi:hypothetical protein
MVFEKTATSPVRVGKAAGGRIKQMLPKFKNMTPTEAWAAGQEAASTLKGGKHYERWAERATRGQRLGAAMKSFDESATGVPGMTERIRLLARHHAKKYLRS